MPILKLEVAEVATLLRTTLNRNIKEGIPLEVRTMAIQAEEGSLRTLALTLINKLTIKPTNIATKTNSNLPQCTFKQVAQLPKANLKDISPVKIRLTQMDKFQKQGLDNNSKSLKQSLITLKTTKVRGPHLKIIIRISSSTLFMTSRKCIFLTRARTKLMLISRDTNLHTKVIERRATLK